MINKECFTKYWLDKIKSDYPLVDPTILEKSIYAFELLSLLKEEGLDFIFKGGTALLILLPEPKRLSIDVDILTSVSKNQLEKHLDSIIKKEIFFEWKENPRTETKIPKKHYKLFFNSVINTNKNSSITLDVLFENNPYPKTESKIIQSKFFNTDYDIFLTVPSINSILGDKLTAFAPKTTGIPFGVNKSMQINKQLFDIGELFDFSDDIKEIRSSFDIFVKIESDYREKSFSSEEVIKDIFEISLLISQIRLRGGIENEITNEFIQGMKALRTHLIFGKYNEEHTKLNSAKAAFLVSAFGKEIDFNILKQYDFNKLTNDKLTGDLAILEKLKTILPNSYYYWQLIQRGFV